LTKKRLLNGIILISILIPLIGSQFQAVFAITGTTTKPETEKQASPSATLPSLRDFSNIVKNGRSDIPTGIFVPGVMALPIVQQPTNNAGYVSSTPETLTQFRMASQYRSTGILAHDYLAGTHFTQLKVGQEVAVVYGDGSMRFFRIYEIQKYQALTPSSPYSNFVDLSTNNKLSAETLFYRTYGLGNNTLILQTCISTEKISSWGRLFVLARPADNLTLSIAQFIPNIEKALASAARSLTASQVLTASR